jgi:hypothetical protein
MSGDIYVTKAPTPAAPSDATGAPGPVSAGDQVVSGQPGQATLDLLQSGIDGTLKPSGVPVPSGSPTPTAAPIAAPSPPGQSTLDLLQSGIDGKLPPPPKKTTPATAGSIVGNFGAGLSEGAIDTLGVPVDATAWLMNKGIQAVNSATGSTIPTIDNPVGGSQSIKQAFGAVDPRMNPESTVAQTPAESIARGIGSGVSSALVPEAGVVGLGKTGLANAYPMAAKALESAFGSGSSGAQTATNAAIGGLSGGTGEGAAAVVPEPLQPVARLAGNLVGGVAGAGLAEAPTLAREGASAIRDYAAPFQGDANSPQKLALAQRLFVKGVADRNQALENSRTNGDTGVGGVPLTSYQSIGDRGIGSMEREAETANPAPFNERRAQQNEARVGVIKALQPTGDPAAVSAHIRDQLAELDDALAGVQRQATTHAQAKTAEIGGTAAPEDIGNVARTQLAANHAGAKAWEKTLWDAIDPDGKLALGTAPISGAARRIESGMSETAKKAKPIEGSERKLFDAAQALGPVSKLKEVTDLRSLVSEEMRAQRGPNGSPTVLARLTQLRGAIEQAIVDAAEHKAAQESVAVKANAMRAKDTMAARLEAERHGFEQAAAENARINIGGDGARNVGLRSEGVRGASGTEVPPSVRSGNAAGSESLSSPDQQARVLAAARPAQEGERVVNVDVAKVDRDWKDTGFHVAPGSGGKAQGAADFLGSLKDGDTFAAPSLGVQRLSDGTVTGFDDGRNRFAAMRDAGMKTAPVSMDERSIENARQAGYIVGEPKPPLEANMDAEAADRIKAASEATKEKNDTFKKGPVGDFLAERGAKDDFRILDSGFGGKFWKPGPGGADAVRSFATATGNDVDAIQTLSDAAALSLRKAAVDDKGVMDPAKYAAWAKSHSDALRALGEVGGSPEQFATAAKAGEAVADATAMRAATLDAYQKGALGKIMGLSDAQGVTDEIGKLFARSDRIQAMRQLAAEVKDNPDARDGLRKAVADFLESKAISNKDKVKGDVFQNFVKQNRTVLAQIFDKDELKGIDAVAAELKHVSTLADEQGLPGRPTTAQDIVKYLKTANESRHGHLSLFAEMLLGADAGKEIPGGPMTKAIGAAVGAGSAVAKKLIQAKRAAGMNDVSALMQKMILYPEMARTALEQAAPTKLISRDIKFTQQLNRVAAIAASRAISNRQDARKGAANVR